ncbi:AarF/UbiB family protein [Candidatus Sarmatiella mevalonica]|uniref:AarF/UbiB family protein n=1 Tax=Candidatus Sarmatiella mevalonica TaxID=2770581 RepID=UPI001923856D|nr:AarF/UbiB family protein [Candidatus Sarmatiella mevalonica]
MPRTSFEDRLVLCIQKIGCIYIKFAQILSTRSDLLGHDLAVALSLCQNSPMLREHINITQTIQNNLHTPPFSFICPTPIASASIAQVYSAQMRDGSKVVIKILKPKIRANYHQCIKHMASLLRMWSWLNNNTNHESYDDKPYDDKEGNHSLLMRGAGIISQLKQIMLQELDLRLEAANIEQMRQTNKTCIIPCVYWQATCSNLITMEMMEGVSVSEYIKSCTSQTRKSKVAKNMILTFLQQVFDDGLFHADLHHSNILISPHDEIILLDFGIVSYIEKKERIAIAQILFSLIKKDYLRVARIHRDIGFIPSSTNLHLFAQSCRAVVEPILNLPANQISVATLMADLLRLSRNFNMPTQPQLFLLHKSLFMLEGMVRELNSEINLWNIAAPWIASWVQRNFVHINKTDRDGGIDNGLISEILNKLSSVDIYFSHR